MKKHQQVIKILILTLFVISMLYLTLKDDLQDILQLLQNLDFYHSLLLITVSFITCILGGVIIGMLGHKAQDDYRLYNGISNGLVSLFLMNVSASAFAKAAQMVMFKMKKLKADVACSILVMDQLLYQISYLLLAAFAIAINYDFLVNQFMKEIPFAFIGFLIGFIPLIAVSLLFFWPFLQHLLIQILLWFMKKLNRHVTTASIEIKLEQFCKSLQAVNILYVQDRKLLLRIHLVNTLRLILRHSLPILIAIALHIEVSLYDIPLFFSASFFVDLILSSLPIYGKHGVAETTFALIFTPIVGKVNAAAMMLLWRVITFYTNTILCGIYTIVTPDINIQELKAQKAITKESDKR